MTRIPADIRSILSGLDHGKKTVRFGKNQIIYSSGDASDSVFYVDHGSVKLSVTSKDGKEAVLAILDGGNFFGERSLDPERVPRSNDAIALTNVTATRIDRNAMLAFLHVERDASDAFISCLIRLVAQLKQEHSEDLLYSSDKRLALAIISISKLGGNCNSAHFPRLSQQDFANMIGITRQRVNVLLKRFKKMGFIDYGHRGISVHNSIRKLIEEDY
jgi:CRP/FNR family transcriptional regulator, cyclic AMP receptor protein